MGFFFNILYLISIVLGKIYIHDCQIDKDFLRKKILFYGRIRDSLNNQYIFHL